MFIVDIGHPFFWQKSCFDYFKTILLLLIWNTFVRLKLGNCTVKPFLILHPAEMYFGFRTIAKHMNSIFFPSSFRQRYVYLYLRKSSPQFFKLSVSKQHDFWKAVVRNFVYARPFKVRLVGMGSDFLMSCVPASGRQKKANNFSKLQFEPTKRRSNSSKSRH